jgi:hypothetical protein
MIVFKSGIKTAGQLLNLVCMIVIFLMIKCLKFGVFYGFLKKNIEKKMEKKLQKKKIWNFIKYKAKRKKIISSHILNRSCRFFSHYIIDTLIYLFACLTLIELIQLV